MARTKSPAEPRLVGGPYRTPRCKIGGILYDVLLGDLRVTGLTEGPIPWPVSMRRGGSPRVIVTPELAAAVALESVLAITHHWGFDRSTVSRLRAKLGIGRWTAGTKQLWRDLWPKRLGREAARRGAATANAKRARERAAATG
jgi:hypothetical protein